MKIISLNYFTDHIKKVICVFRSNWNSFNMIFTTIIQPKIHKSNGFPKWRICFHHFYFNLFSLQNIFLVDIILISSCTFSFRSSCTFFSFNRFQSSCTFFLNIFSEVVVRSLKHIEILQKQSHNLQHKKYVKKQLHIFLHSFCTKYTHFVWRFS